MTIHVRSATILLMDQLASSTAVSDERQLTMKKIAHTIFV